MDEKNLDKMADRVIGMMRGMMERGISAVADRVKALEARQPEKGDRGEKGEPGSHGERGEKGIPGEAGAKGDIGAQGPAGERGPIGEKGDRGERGEPGEFGQKGDRGEKGDPGEAGAQGPAGPQGERGENGDPGRDGERGADGSVGAKGDPGPAGKDGEPGRVGEIGPQGERGLVGARGEQGPIGERGADGLTGSVGPAGEKGDQGIAGKDGAPGRDGKDVDPEQVKSLVEQRVAELLPALVEKAIDLASTAIAVKAAALIPAPAPGRDGRDGLSVQGEKGLDGEPGRDGRDGFTLDDVSAELKDGRTLVLEMRTVDRVVTKEFQLDGMPIYRGLFQSGQKSKHGDCYTWGGSMWMALKHTDTSPPGEDWRLVVKGTK